MKIIADLHIHSKYSRAVSGEMVPDNIARWAVKKGINLVATGDWTHPIWLRELKLALDEAGKGVYRLRNKPSISEKMREVNFVLSTEISCIFSQEGKVRRIHLLIIAPSFAAVERINRSLARAGVKLMSDGRPTIGMSVRDVVRLIFEAEESSLVIPGHIWTPWFSLFGANSGFDSIDECFGDLSQHIFAVETGLSSDPAMNWRIKELDTRSIVSFSDAHSPAKIGREATVFELPEVSFDCLFQAIRNRYKDDRHGPHVLFTVEFYPEEGKYHYTGHRNCGIRQTPRETKSKGLICHVCGKRLTVGVMHRVEQLAGRQDQTEVVKDEYGVRWIKGQDRPPYVMMVPLAEILADTLGTGVTTQTVKNEYEKLVSSLGSEFKILLRTKPEDIERVSGPKIREAIMKVRTGDIVIDPGYDGVFGTVKVWLTAPKSSEDGPNSTTSTDQIGLF